MVQSIAGIISELVNISLKHSTQKLNVTKTLLAIFLLALEEKDKGNVVLLGRA